MGLLILAMTALLQTAPRDALAVRLNLQGMYDEIAQATRLSASASDVDIVHDVFYTPDWVFVDQYGQRYSWTDLREQAIRTSGEDPFDVIRLAIQQLSLAADSAVTQVNIVTVRTITDTDGKYGRPGLTHTIAEVTPVRDTWTLTGVTWKLRSREQLGGPKVYLDRMPPEIDDPQCPA